MNCIRKHLKSKKGFTLIELLIVVLIIGVLAAIAVPRFTSSANSAAKAKIQADLRTIDSAIAIMAANGVAVPGTVSAVANAGYLSSEPKAPNYTSTSGASFTITSGTVYTISGTRAVVGTSYTSDLVP